MRSIIKYFIEHPTIVTLGLLLLVALGAMKLSQTQTTYFPNQRIRFITVAVPYPGASPTEVETGITIKIEEELEGIQGIDRVTSSSSESIATVLIELTEASVPNTVLAEVKNAIDKINNFPERAESPIIEKIEPKDLALTLGVIGDVPLSVKKDYAEQIKDELLGNPQVSQVEINGLPEEEISIDIRESDLLRYQLSFQQVAAAVSNANIETFGGEVKTKASNITIKADNKGYFAKELQNIIVKSSPDGSVVRLKEVADVRDQFADVPTGRFANNKQILTITTAALGTENILEIANATRTLMADFNATHDNVKLEVFEDGTKNVEDQIKAMVNNGITGIILVLIVLALFLDRYLAFWVALKIPVAIVGMFVLSDIQGLTINVVSLFGFILVLGILVDDGVVIGENIYQWAKKKGASPAKAALEGTMEMLVPVLISLTTTAVAFSLFFFLPTQAGEFFGEMGFVVIAVLIIAMIESFFFLPAHLAHSKGLRADHKPFKIEIWFDAALNWVRERIYMPAFSLLSISNRFLSLGTVVLFVVALFFVFSIVPKVGFTFFPTLDDDAVFTELQMQPGTPVELTQKRLGELEKAAWAANQEFSKGRADGEEVIQIVEQITGPRPNQGKLKITFMGGEKRGISSFTIVNRIRELTPSIPEAVSVVHGIGATNAVFGKPVSFALYSNDLEDLRQAKKRLKTQMETVADLKDVSDTDEAGVQEIQLALKPKAELLGLSLGQVMAQVRAGFFGQEVQRIQRGSDEVKIWIRYPRADRSRIDQLLGMRVQDGRGNSYLLEDIADVNFATSTLSINHLEGKREIRVEANVASKEVSAPGVITSIEADFLPAILADYPTVSYSVEGQNRSSFKMGAAIGTVGPIILLFIFSLIVLNFNSFSQGLIVFGLFPFALIGVILGHWIQGEALNIFSFVGTIALIGVFVNNSLVFISTLNQLLEEGTAWKEALIETAQSRFRPILLTTVTTVAGLAPLLASSSISAQFLKGPAISIAYGLSFGLFNVLLLLPALLHLTNGGRLLQDRIFRKGKKTAAEVEPAVRNLKNFITE